MAPETISTLGMNSPSGLSQLTFTDHSISAMRISEGEKTLRNYLSNFTFLWKKIKSSLIS